MVIEYALLKDDAVETDSPETWFDRGLFNMKIGDFSEAELCFRRALDLAPRSMETILNLGYALDKKGYSAEAFACYEAVLSETPTNAKARYNRAAHLFRSGDFINGFADYEYRFAAVPGADNRSYSQPRWDGSPLLGRSILVYCEQGLGDAIMFFRFLPLLKGLGAKVILEVQEPLISLFCAMEVVDQVVAKAVCPPATDVHIPLLSLPFLFKTTMDSIPHQVPFLSVPYDLLAFWRERINQFSGRFNIGLAWSGKPFPDPDRSCPPSNLLPLLAFADAGYFSLQMKTLESLPLPPEFTDVVIDLTGEISDFANTAALIANLDLVITIDTAVAHLAGALGKPVWVMLPAAADWRWLLDRTDSPWYPTMRLFRQPHAGDWDSVVCEVARALRTWFSTESCESKLSDEQLASTFQQALTAIEKNDPDAAIKDLTTIFKQLPDDPAVLFNLGRAYTMLDRFTEAQRAYRQALVALPDSPALWFALGDVRLKQSTFPEAEFCLRKAHSLKPDSIEILLNLGSALSSQSKKAEAFETCQKILAIQPDCLDAIYNMSMLQLRDGDYLSGFANFETRLAIEKFNIDFRKYRQPRWDGSPLNGKSILIYGEQGMGDVIQFARYIPFVAERGGRVVFEVDPQLIPLFENFPGVELLVPKSVEPPLTDVYIQSISLAHLFKTTVDTIPYQEPYLFADKEKSFKWKQILGDNAKFRVGLVWRGNPKNPHDKERSCQLNTFAPLAYEPGVHFYSLQLGDCAAESASPPDGMNLIDLTRYLTDFTETAALMANLDLIISVDTAVAHLAGAMGLQVWVILPESSEWRWLEGRENTPWYPSMRVFEHGQVKDWEGVIQRARNELKRMVAARHAISEQLNVEVVFEQGLHFKETGDLVAAERCFRQITDQKPELPDPQYCLAVMLQLQGKLQEAISCYRVARTLDPSFTKAHYNLAISCQLIGLYQEAKESAQHTIECDSAHPDAHWLLGMLLLQSGDFARGWKEYEWRWKARGFASRTPDLAHPLWDGTPLGGKTLLIHMEQGRGDMIQFIRYASLAVGSSGKVIVCALPELVSLLATCDGVSRVIDREQGVLPFFDVHAPAQSLPYLFGTILETIPQGIPYLRSDSVKEAEFQRVFLDEERFRIGLVWQGTPTHLNDKNRSCVVRDFFLLADLDGVDFYSLQVGPGREQLLELPAGMTITDATELVRDFSDTAAIIAGLDLVISVDTAVAHLAGALGKPVWTLLPFVAEWRWLLEREDTPWYPTMRLFRQTSAGDWQGVFSRVRSELKQLLGNAAALNQLGITLLKSASIRRADQALLRAIKCEPENVELYCNRGVVFDTQGRYEEAFACYHKALELSPTYIPALLNLGNTCLGCNRLDEARVCYENVTRLNPDLVQAHVSLGETFKKSGNFAGARTEFECAVKLDPSCAEAFQGIAEVSQALEEFETAISAYSRSLCLKPDRPETLNLMGTAYQSIERLDKAEECYRRALYLAPETVSILNNLAVVLCAQGRLEESVVVYRRLLEVDSDYADGHWNLAVALLAMGAYTEGWREFEWRFKKVNPVASRSFLQLRWDGSDLAGRTILLHAEQGFGDTIQFSRFIPLVARRGGRVVVECQAPLLKRLLLSVCGVVEVIAAGETLPYFDCHLPLMSLPMVFRTTVETIPSDIPYLSAPPADVEEWRKRLGPAASFRVGLVWFAKQSQVLNRKRSCQLELLAPLWDVPGVEFFSLQIGLGSEQIAQCEACSVITDYTGSITDFADTAAFIANLDLVISIDTAAAHLAGALGAPVWVILPYTAEWRWLSGREDSPWYRTMRLFRQPAPGDWSSLMNNVAFELRDRVEKMQNYNNFMSARSNLMVGLAWSGRLDNPLNCKRSCPYSLLAPLLDIDGITFVNLQLETFECIDSRMIDLTDQIHDFEDTAALMTHLDLIISIDTSIAHLAASIGRPTWVLLPHVSDWRWLTDSGQSPWYPSIRLFRQRDHGEWEGAIQEVAQCLIAFARDRLSWNEKVISTYTVDGCSCERQMLGEQLDEYQNLMIQDGNNPSTHLNFGATLLLSGRYDEAKTSFKRVLELDPDNVEAHLNLAYSMLAMGDYLEGWRNYEWRLMYIDPRILPPWAMLTRDELGSSVYGSSVLVHCEQGFGDSIQFCRFLPQLADFGYRVIVSCQPPMAALMGSVRGVYQVVKHGEPLPVCDCQVLLLSLPFLFSSTMETLPKTVPYLAPRQSIVHEWGKRLGQFSR